MIFALAGNQNCGKTTLFNQLTGSNRHVGNFPGVTVDQKMGEIRGSHGSMIVDLPGIYSIRPYTNEEIVTRDFLLNESPDGIINIVDATNIERNLYLTLQLIELGIPTVLALNMMDELSGNGGTVDIRAMSESLGIPVIPISAAKNEGVDELIAEALRVAKGRIVPKRIDFCKDGAVHRCIHAVSHMIEDHATAVRIAPRFAATKLIEEDPEIIAKLELDKNEIEMIEHSILEMESEEELDRHEALAAMRYDFIESVCKKTVVKGHESRERIRSEKIDRIVTNRYLAIPIFILVMLSVFALTFAVIGAALQDLLALGIDALAGAVEVGMIAVNVNPVVQNLVLDGIFGGVGAVVSFVPQIVVLFFFLSILEDTGYMARIAFVMDKLLRKIGLSGRSFVPMLIGFGCTVPAVMSARTLSSERDRKMTILLVPFMSCSAKTTIYLFFAEVVFGLGHFGTFALMAGLYFGGIAVGILFALLLNKTAFRGKPVPFVMELPNYRFPSAKSVLSLMWEKARDFLEKAFTTILLASIIVWFLSNFTPTLYPIEDGQLENSILAKLASLIAVVFAPLGFGSWQAVTALISGFTAKEAVVSTLKLLLPTTEGLLAVFSPKAAVSFLVFTLIYTPCVAAISAIRRELGSHRAAAGVVLLQCGVAWICSFAVYRFLLLSDVLIWSDYLIIAGVICAIVFAVGAIRKNKKAGKCACGCESCGGQCASCSGKCDGCHEADRRAAEKESRP